MNRQRWGRRPCVVVWLLLLCLTAVTFAVGEVGLGGAGVVIGVLLLTAFKGRLVVDYYMGLRRAPALWRRLLLGYLLVVTAAIAVSFVA